MAENTGRDAPCDTPLVTGAVLPLPRTFEYDTNASY